MPGMSLGLSVASYTGQNIGAGRIDRAKLGFWAATKIIIIFSCIMTPLIYLFGGSVMRMFTDAPEIARIGTKAIRITCMFYIPVGMIYVSRNLLSGAGDVKVPMIMGGSEVLSRVIFANVLTAIPVIGYMGIWWATGLNWFVTGLIGCVFYASGRWMNKSIISKG
jgi:Na+-driven multidrug efflux pump